MILTVCVWEGVGDVGVWGVGGRGARGMLLVHYRMFSNIPDLYPLDARSMFQLQLWQKIRLVRENRCKGLHIMWFHLYEVVRERSSGFSWRLRVKWELSENWGTFWCHTLTRCLLRGLITPWCGYTTLCLSIHHFMGVWNICSCWPLQTMLPGIFTYMF